MNSSRQHQERVIRFGRTSSLLLAGAVAAVLAQQSHAKEAEAQELDTVIVLGKGESRQVQTLTAAQVEQLAAGTSPLKAIERMPGVNFQSADAFGTYEWSTRITVRGFNQNRMGFTLDGVPLGDMTYGNHNGLHISRAIPSEDIGSITLAQGTGAVQTASFPQRRNRNSAYAHSKCSAANRHGARTCVSTAAS
jgi:iron complex outermembrane recepter protein